MFCALQGHYISGERLQDHWSSGFKVCWLLGGGGGGLSLKVLSYFICCL